MTTTNTDVTKVPTPYLSREVAHAALKQLGIEPKNYGAHVEERSGKFHLVNLPGSAPAPAKQDAKDPEVQAAKKQTPLPHAEKKSPPKASAKKAEKKAKPAKAAAKKPSAEKKEPRVTVASTVLDLVKAGKDNKEIWKIIQPKFKLTDEQAYYPSWYRWNIKRQAAKAAKAKK